MASIIVDLSDDIKKMKSLKEEIQQVKRELGTINVKVDLDIKRDMEARLKSLTDQYDALVQKVAQEEAKIAESAARINKSAKTIINAQEQMAKSATGQGGTNTQGASGGNSAATNAQTASVEAQAKAYDELKDAIEGYLGTMEGNARYIAETESAISNVKKNISLLRKEIDAKGGIANEAQLNNLAHYTEELERLKIQLQDARRDLKTDLRINVAGEGSLAQLRNQLLQMQRVWDGMVESVRNSPIGQEFAKSIDVLNRQVSELEQTMGRYQRNVGNYASGWNGLNMSIQQIGRELPSLAMGWNTFFLAISNNLPILADEIKRAKNEYNELKKAGQQATPVWKQVASSLLSWQTALTVGITLLTMYGKDIVEWAKNALVGESAAEKLKKQLLELNEIEKDAHATQIRTRAELDNVISSIKNFNGTREQEKQKIDELNSKYGSIFGSYNSLAQWYDILISKGDDYINSLFAQAKAQSYIQKAIEADQKIRDIKANGIEEYRPLWGRGGRIYQFFGGGNTNLGSDPAKLAYDEALRLAEEERDDFLENAEQLQKEYLQGIKKAGIFDYRALFDTDKDGAVNSLKSYLDELSKLQEDYEDRQIDLMKDGTEKQLAEINLRYDRELEAVKKLRANLEKAQGGKLTTEQTFTLDAAVAGIETGRKMETGNVWKEQIRQQEQAWNEYLQKYGIYQQKRKAIIEQYNREISEAQTAGEAATLQKQMEEALSDLDISALKTTSAISGLFGDMTDKTLAELNRINEQGSAALEFLKSGQWDEEQGLSFGITKEQFDTLSKSPDKLKAISDALNDNRRAADELRPAYEKIADGLRKIFNAGDDSKKLKDALSDMQDGLNEVMQTAQYLSDTFSNLGDAFGSEAISGIAEGINVAIGTLNAGMQGAQAGAMFGPIGAAAGAALGVVSSLASSIAQIHDKKNEKRIQRLQDQIDTLDASYEKLGRSIEKAYSTDASSLIEDQNKLLEQQKVLIQQQIQEEQDKKKTDDDRIKEWQQQIEEINQTIEDNKEKAVDAIFGEDLQSAIENFSSSYADAWANGEDRAQSARDTVKQMMQQMVTESIKAAIKSSSKMEEIRQKLQQFYADNVLTGWEQDYIYDMAEQLQQQLDNQFGWADNLFQNQNGQQQQSASAGYSIAASQDSVDVLNGRLTAMYEAELRIEQGGSAMRDIAAETRSIIAQSYLELQQISENTGEIIKPIKQMQLDIAEVKRNTSKL